MVQAGGERWPTHPRTPAGEAACDLDGGGNISSGSRSRPLEVVALFEILDEPGPGGLPAQSFPSRGARCRGVDRPEDAHPSEVLAGVFGSERYHADVQMPS